MDMLNPNPQGKALSKTASNSAITIAASKSRNFGSIKQIGGTMAKALIEEAPDFRELAKKTYGKLKPVYEAADKGHDFWVCGHVFDTVIDYFLNIDKSDADSFAILAQKQSVDPGGAWYDDFSWWGIAALRASAAAVFSQKNQAEFRKIAVKAWEGASKGRDGWKDADQKKFAQFAPLFDGSDGGVWNHIIDDDYNPTPPQKNPPRQGGDPFGARQNTVTNAAYWVLAGRFYLETNQSSYRDAMAQEYRFLTKWFDYLPLSNLSLLRTLATSAIAKTVVRERVSKFKSGEKDWVYDPEFSWAGDQGLILGGWLNRLRMPGLSAPEYKAIIESATSLLFGSQDYLTRGKAKGILQPWWPSKGIGGDEFNKYKRDYWTGQAVYMRYLLAAFQVQDLRKSLQSQVFQDFIRQNADSVVNDPKREPAPQELVRLSNDLAILVAAVAMLPKQ